MKALSLILSLILSLNLPLFATTHTVKQDGTGDYTLIQEAINASHDGDTVLAWPGTYFENVDFSGKNITLASLALTTGDMQYRYNTIIDGYQNGSCVRVMSGESSAVLFGFTLQHGSGTNWAHPVLYSGGGIIIAYSSCSVMHCDIRNNHVDGDGGGIYVRGESLMSLINTSIRQNHADGRGGGILLGWASNIEFDSALRSSLYLNYASKGIDFIKANDCSLLMFLDTCTVQQPDSYFISSTDQNGYQIDDITLNIQHHVLTPKDADLYVNPLTGDNSNSGLSPDEPLKSIAFAYSSIKVDSLEKNTIHLADGIYSDSANTEKFPLNIRPYINIVGQSVAGTILDGEYKSRIFKGNNEVSNYSFRKMTMFRGGKVDSVGVFSLAGFGVLYAQNDHVIIDSIHFVDAHCYPIDGALNIQASSDVMVSNCVFSGTIGGYAFFTGLDIGDTLTVSNCIFVDNLPDYNQEYELGGGIWLAGGGSMAIVQNCLFTGNDQTAILASVGGYHPDFKPVIVNCTFTGNTHLEDLASLALSGAGSELINCIMYDEGTVSVAMNSWESLDTIVLNINHSLIEGGPDAVVLYPGELLKLIYDESNIDSDPMFYGGFEFPYNLSENSPCIDAGILVLPSFVQLPETDLAGNPRVYGSSIDMGAYEWNPTVGVNKFRPQTPDKEKLLSVAPNPFSFSTQILIKTTLHRKLKLEVYNNYGQRMKVLMDGIYLPGTSIVNWDGLDEYNQPIPPGVYHLVLVVDGKEVEEMQVIKH